MGRFKRSLFGYRRDEVDEAIAIRDTRIFGLEASLDRQVEAVAELEGETGSLAGMVIEREREIRTLRERLTEANACHDRSIASLEAVSARLEELQAQARGQATRIRMKALREAVEVSKRVKALSDAHGMELQAPEEGAAEGYGAGQNGAASNGHRVDFNGLFSGQVRLEIGPLGDFSQLVGFEDAVGRTGASEISIERFSEGRATLSMRLEEPTELLRELEDLSSLDFRVRHTAPDNLILDIDEDGPGEQHAA
ncbi:MAG TPA: hypothetical protein VHI77_06625 [Solirubrobacterales bacterium]|jgi:hypothetical protein|nr:hypothetical protein [Solirubrobacterales bacterium]